MTRSNWLHRRRNRRNNTRTTTVIYLEEAAAIVALSLFGATVILWAILLNGGVF